MNRMFCLVLALGLAGCAAGHIAAAPAVDSKSPARFDLPPQIVSFIAGKEAHARELARKLKLDVDEDYWTFFGHARRGDWPAAERLYESLLKRTGQDGSTLDPRVGHAAWQTVTEVIMALEAYCDPESAPKWSTAYGEGIVKSISRGSIYFGGTDPGRGLPTAFSKSHAGGDPFFTITQNALADHRYLEYIRATYSGKIYTPTEQDSQNCLSNYIRDAQARFQHDKDFPAQARQIKPGEDVKLLNDKVQVNIYSLVSGMAINGLLTKLIFDKNPEREFYVEESYPLDWMYPYLAPHGPIMKVHRAPLATLPPDAVAKDREFWTKQQAAMIGDWLTPETSVKEICEFAEKTFLRKDLAGFKGDPTFVQSRGSTKIYSKLRSSLGGLYNWRIQNAKSPEEQQRMIKEADFAFRQAFALCPVSPEAIYRYVNLLVQRQRIDDALLIASTAERLNPKDDQLENLIVELERIRNSQPK